MIFLATSALCLLQTLSIHNLSLNYFSCQTILGTEGITMATGSPQDIAMTEGQTPPPMPSEEPKYGGFTRFEIELEVIPPPLYPRILDAGHPNSSQFVQSLASPQYLNYLASQKYFENPAFIAYLSYLQYWSHPPYTKYLTYPGPTLKNLELLQQERFRADILSPDKMNELIEEGMKSGMEGPRS
jgi:mediator of RNA polymerase II transcription subunit 31